MNERYTKGQWTTDIAARTGATQADVRRMMSALFATMHDALAEGKSIILPDIGSLSVRVRKPRRGRNPRTGEPITIPERKVIALHGKMVG